jgi:hypothetical protein
MDNRKFRTKRLTAGKDRWSRRRSQAKTTQRYRKFLANHSDGSNDVRLGSSKTRDGEIEWSGWIKPDTADERIADWCQRADGSDVLHVAAGREDPQKLAIQAVFVKGFVPGVDNDPRILEFFALVTKRTKGVAENWGIFSCRKVAGTDTWSAHAWKMAIDIAGPWLVMVLVAHLAVKHAARFGFETIIFNGKSWSRAEGWHPYSGSCPHKRHCHINTDYPDGRPPCAE